MKKSYQTIHVILPLALPGTYTYAVPEDLIQEIGFGKRVEVPLRNKLYSAIVVTDVTHYESDRPLKKVRAVIDDEPILNEHQFKLWNWLAKYYCCSLGEVMSVALPGGLKLYSETRLIPMRGGDDYLDLSLDDHEYMVMEAIHLQGELTIDEVREILNKKNVYSTIKKLLDKNQLVIKEELVEKFKPKKQKVLSFPLDKEKDEAWLGEMFEKIDKSENQRRALLAFIQHKRTDSFALKSQVVKTAKISSSVISALIKKGIFVENEMEVSRISKNERNIDQAADLSPLQSKKIDEINVHWQSLTAVLLHGVTGSGKTRIFIDCIQKVLNENGQVLYLLPEIALTTQIVQRLRDVFGDRVLVYHSRLNSHERVELYKKSMEPGKIILGARSAIFMPFTALKLIVVDEEHDPSYKQQDPAPRYNARDVAMVLANHFKAKVLLGSATPSLESWLNAKNGKYGYVSILERFGNSVLPTIELVDLKKAYKQRKMTSYYSHQLIESIKDTIIMGRQVILFQNRRGFAPVLQCELCGWKSECKNCDTTLTLHKYFEELRCHYCGFRQNKPEHCPDCGNPHLKDTGFGTEKLEVELAKILPDARIARLDYDTAKTRNAYDKILYQFASGQLDVLIGTQMVTKGLDFNNVSLVGILNADRLMAFPDFRANERAFQLMIQVSGRAGRRATKGKVLIQTFNPAHRVFTDVLNNDFERFFEEEQNERLKSVFPPEVRMIEITLKHKKPEVAKEAGFLMRDLLRKQINDRVSNLFEPSISRLRGYFIQKLMIRIEKNPKAVEVVKKWVQYYRSEIRNSDGYKSVRINIDVDPY